MIDLTLPADQIVAKLKQVATAGDDEALFAVAECARSGFLSQSAAKKPRRGDALHNLLTESINSLLSKSGTVPGFDSIVKNLWQVDNIENPCIVDISGEHRFVIWQDFSDEYQKTSFRCIKARINRILEKQGIAF